MVEGAHEVGFPEIVATPHGCRDRKDLDVLRQVTQIRLSVVGATRKPRRSSPTTRPSTTRRDSDSRKEPQNEQRW